MRAKVGQAGSLKPILSGKRSKKESNCQSEQKRSSQASAAAQSRTRKLRSLHLENAPMVVAKGTSCAKVMKASGEAQKHYIVARHTIKERTTECQNAGVSDTEKNFRESQTHGSAHLSAHVAPKTREGISVEPSDKPVTRPQKQDIGGLIEEEDCARKKPNARQKHVLKERDERGDALDLPGYVHDLCAQEGYEYGVQFVKQVTRSKAYRLNVRLRCLMHKKKPPGSGCQAAFMAKALRNGQGWIVSASYAHNHERLSTNCLGKKDKRRDAVKSVILKNCPSGYKILSIHYNPTALKKGNDSDDDDFTEVQVSPRPQRVKDWLGSLSTNQMNGTDHMNSKEVGNLSSGVHVIYIKDDHKGALEAKEGEESVVIVAGSEEGSVVDNIGTQKEFGRSEVRSDSLSEKSTRTGSKKKEQMEQSNRFDESVSTVAFREEKLSEHVLKEAGPAQEVLIGPEQGGDVMEGELTQKLWPGDESRGRNRRRANAEGN
ncbi:hypothetical protein FGB62_22g97 [Gracilaria domingensis]|nr:hypothetical protein FGB62_22g97 [Gracilaria domingensis]